MLKAWNYEDNLLPDKAESSEEFPEDYKFNSSNCFRGHGLADWLTTQENEWPNGKDKSHILL